MKIQNLAIIFTIIVIPIALVLSLLMSNRAATVRAESYYNTSLAIATRDGIKALEYNSYDNRFLAIADTIVRDAKATINTFLNSLAMNLGLGDSGMDALKPYIPAVAYVLYDGYYVYTPDIVEDKESGRDVLEHSLKPFIYYTKEYRAGSKRVIINYTLDNFITAHIYSSPGQYESLIGYIVDTNKVNVTPRPSLDPKEPYNPLSCNVYISNIEITVPKAKEFYWRAYKFTSIMKHYGPLSYKDDDGVTHSFHDLFDSSDPGSNFDTERINTIKDTLQSTLNATIGNYNSISEGFGKGGLYNFKMPVLKPTEWDIVLSNISLITFFQGVNIGSKYYNGYKIASSFANSYFTPDSELCFADNNRRLHRIDCPELNEPITDSGKYLNMSAKMLLERKNSYNYR